MGLQPGDELVWVARCADGDSMLLAASNGMTIRFPADQVGSSKPACRSPLPVSMYSTQAYVTRQIGLPSEERFRYVLEGLVAV